MPAAHASTMPAAQKSAGTAYSPAYRRFQAALADLALSAREQLELVVQAGIDALDDLDGDIDLEMACEDEAAQCDDEGVDTDREQNLDYANDGWDQTRFAGDGSRWVNELGAR